MIKTTNQNAENYVVLLNRSYTNEIVYIIKL